MHELKQLKFLRINAGHCKQAIKTGIAALLCLYVTDYLGLSQGYWAAISSVIVLQSHMGATIKASLGRLVATAIGAAVGAIIVAALGKSHLSVAGAITLAALLCASKRLRDSYRLAGSTVVSVMLSSKFTSPWQTALERFVEVSLGILVALIVSKTLWPSRARQQLRLEIQQCLVRLLAQFQAVIERYHHNATASIDQLQANVRDSARRIHDLRQHAIYEADDAQFPNEMVEETITHVRLIRQAIEGLELATHSSGNDAFQSNFEPELDQLLRAISASLENLASKLWTPQESFDAMAIRQAVEALDSKTTAIWGSVTFTEYPIPEILRCHSFLVSLRSLAVELLFIGQQQLNRQ